MENQFTNFIKPYLSWIDSGVFFGKPFRWLYAAFAVLNLLNPVFVLITGINNRVFEMSFKFGFAFILLWMAIAFASWVGFQVWWNRRVLLPDSPESTDEFVATPVVAHLLQTVGEWIGSWVAIVGTFFSLVISIVLGDEAYYLAGNLGLGFLGGGGFLFSFVFPVVGYLIIVFSRFLSEQVKVLAAIANNTKK